MHGAEDERLCHHDRYHSIQMDRTMGGSTLQQSVMVCTYCREFDLTSLSIDILLTKLSLRSSG